MNLAGNKNRRLLFASVAVMAPLFLVGCGTTTGTMPNTDPDTATGVAAVESQDQISTDIGNQVNAEIARSAAEAANSLQALQEAQAPISTPVVSNKITPATPTRFLDASSSGVTAAPLGPLPPSADPNPNDAYVPPLASPVGGTTDSAIPPISVTAMSHVSLTGLPAELVQPITVRVVGTVANALQQIAERIGYRFVQSGVDTGSHAEIALDEDNAPVADVLQDIGYQVQHYGHVNVDPTSKTITLNLY